MCVLNNNPNWMVQGNIS